jgi:hypothetical protein
MHSAAAGPRCPIERRPRAFRELARLLIVNGDAIDFTSDRVTQVVDGDH